MSWWARPAAAVGRYLVRAGVRRLSQRPRAEISQRRRHAIASALAAASLTITQRDLDRYYAKPLAQEPAPFVTSTGEVPHPSRVLDLFSEVEHRQGELYDAMIEKDTLLAGVWSKRVKAVRSLPQLVQPADSSPRAVEIAEWTARMIAGIGGWSEQLGLLLGGTLRGVAFADVTYHRPTSGPLAGFTVPRVLEDRPMWRFGFRAADRGLFVRGSLGATEPARPGKFLVYRHGTADNPWGWALLDAIWWPHYLERGGWKSFAVALEKWGQPTAVGYYPAGEDEKADQQLQDEILAMLMTIQSDQAIALPEGTRVDTLEAKRGGSISYTGFIQVLQRAKCLLVLGELDTSGVGEGPGSYAKAVVSNAVRLETVKLDAGAISTIVNEQLIHPVIRLNWGMDAPVSSFFIDALEAEDRQLRQAGCQRVLDAGQPVPRSYFYRLHQVPEPRPGEPTVQLPVAPPPAPSPPPASEEAAA